MKRSVRRAWRPLLLLAAVLLGSACRVTTAVQVQVGDDGAGSVAVSTTLDADAVSRAPDWAKGLRTEDLQQAGWVIEGPTKRTDGSETITATKRFANPDEAASIFTEIAGQDGPFRDFRITRARSFARTTTSFDGTVDFARGLGSFADQELATTLDGKPLGDDISAIESRIGDSLDNVFSFRVVVRLPGGVTSNAPGKASNGAEWQPKLSAAAPSSLHAQSRSWRVDTLVATGVAGVAMLGLLLVLLVRVAARRHPS